MSSEGEYFKRETQAGLKTVTSRKKEGPDSKVILMSLLCCSCPSLMTASRSADEEGEYCLTKAAMRSLKRLWRMLIWPPIRSHERQCRESTGESANTSRRLGAREQTQGWLGLMSAEMFKQRRNLTAVINSAGLRWVRRPQEDLQRDQEDQWALFVLLFVE